MGSLLKPPKKDGDPSSLNLLGIAYRQLMETQVYRSDYPFVDKDPQAVTVYCSDNRFNHDVEKYLRRLLRSLGLNVGPRPTATPQTYAGGASSLIHSPDILKWVHYFIDRGGKEIHLVNHFDCKAIRHWHSNEKFDQCDICGEWLQRWGTKAHSTDEATEERLTHASLRELFRVREVLKDGHPDVTVFIYYVWPGVAEHTDRGEVIISDLTKYANMEEFTNHMKGK